MARINVNGSVFYNNMTPAEQVEVQIIEIDATGGNDKILTRTTDSLGKFSGRTSEWKDSEGFGLPDVFVLQFKVITPVGTHTGPFVLTANGSVPIVLPFAPFKPVGINNRELVQITYLSDGLTDPGEILLYDFIESGSNALVDTYLAPQYRRISRLTGNQATLTNLVSKLNIAASRSTTLAVDLVVCTHGGSRSKLYFKDGEKTSTEVKEAILLGIPENLRTKLRMVFSTACFGNTHNAKWIQSGFKVASGSLGIYADSEASLIPFLNAWKNEENFEVAIQRSNDGDIGNVADNLAKAFYQSKGKPELADQVDSTRVIRGNRYIRIYTSPQ